jgi:hypothetical protein
MIITNLLQILFKAPQIINIVKAILDIVGSEQVQKILESIRDALKTEVPNPTLPPETEPQRKRLVRRVFRRLAVNTYEHNESQQDDNAP